jgi:hypothetical protein
LTIPERALILAETFERPLSPSEFSNEWGLDVRKIARHFRDMANSDYLELVAETVRPTGGGRHKPLYRATQRLLYRTEEWEHFALEEREGHTFVVFVTYMSRLSQAINSGTMDAELDRHLTWKAIRLDRRAWTELVTRLDQFLDWVTDELEVEAASRMAESGEDPIPATVGLAGFRSPKASELTMPGATRKTD